MLSDFNLDGKVATVVTDNAPNMLRAFVTIPGIEVNDNVKSDHSDCDEEINDLEFANTCQRCSEIPGHVSCFQHTLQLAVKDGLN